jgi:hypothetical protein
MNANVYILMKVRLNPISSLHDGWSPFGEKIFGISLRKREKNINIIAALNKQTVIAPFIYEGNMNTDLFNILKKNFCCQY